MKSTIFFLIILLTTFTSFSQFAAKKQMQQSSPSTMPMTEKTVVTPSAQEITVKSKNTGTKIITGGASYHIVPLALAKATLNDAFISVSTGGGKIIGTTINDNKDRNTHWSCGLFDQNETDVTSFHDNSDYDEYANGSNRVLKMHIDKPALFSDFEKTGRIHINIAPVGNDTWIISDFSLTLDFLEPKNSQTITWHKITLTQDSRNVDLYFYFDGTNFVARQ